MSARSVVASMNKRTLVSKTLLGLYRRHDVARLSLFGSFARGEAGPESDVDLLVEFKRRNTLLDLIGLEQKMSLALGRKVDLLTLEAISPYLRDTIARDLQVIYEAG